MGVVPVDQIIYHHKGAFCGMTLQRCFISFRTVETTFKSLNYFSREMANYLGGICVIKITTGKTTITINKLGLRNVFCIILRYIDTRIYCSMFIG